MRRTLFIFAAFIIMLSTPVFAGKKMNRCVDPEGRVTFTTQGCAGNESKEKIYVPDAQASISSLRPGEVQTLGNVYFNKAVQHQSIQSSNKQLSWGERQALKNASTGQQSKKQKRRVKRCNK